MSTRLDRLFLLLDTGSTPLIRKSAAEQLGDVQKLHPYELGNLLTKVHTYLRSSNWETRIAAAQAVQAIARNVPQWEPRGALKKEPHSEGGCNDVTSIFTQFNLEKVLHNGASLLGSEGAQFNKEEKVADMDDGEKLVHQRENLNKRLGLGMAGNLNLGLDSGIFTDDDLMTGIKESQQHGVVMDARAIEDLVCQQIGGSRLSAREKNRAKRKAKLIARQISRDSPSNEADVEPPVKKPKSNGAMKDEKPFVTDTQTDTVDEEDWPFDWFCELLMGDLFSSAWETRHGAATGLREVIKLHGRGAGKSMDTPSDQMSLVNQVYLSDLALRLLCVISLDRFGDFVSDEEHYQNVKWVWILIRTNIISVLIWIQTVCKGYQKTTEVTASKETVVAPVRESCAQTLGVVMKYLDMVAIQGVVSILLKLLEQEQWEVRHGGLLGIKYLLAVRRDMTKDLLPAVILFIFQGLQDEDDDVRAVAAAALVPVAEDLVLTMPQLVPDIVLCLWDILLDLDDLTASTNSIMSLLSTLMATPTATVLDWLSKPLTELVPRLWPFLRHNISSVRKSAVEMMYTLLNIESSQHSTNAWLPPLLQALMRHIYQRALLEPKADILEILVKLWCKLLEKSPLDLLVGAATPWLGVWFSLAMQPSKVPFDGAYFIEAKHRGRGEHNTVRGRQSSDSKPENQVKDNQDYIAGYETINSSSSDRDVAVVRTRITAAGMLGNLCNYISQPMPNQPSEGETPLETPLASLCKLLVFHLNTKSAVQRIIVAEVVYYWAQHQECLCPADLKSQLLKTLSETVYYDEIAMGFTRMQTDCKDFIASLKQQGLSMDNIIPPGSFLSLDKALLLVTTMYDEVKGVIKKNCISTYEDRRSQLHTLINQTMCDQQVLSTRVQSSIARAVVVLDAVPDKLNPVIRPLMECIKREENILLQKEAAKTLCKLLRKCLPRDPCPNNKVLKNLRSFLCCDPSNTPVITSSDFHQISAEPRPVLDEACCDKLKGILTLVKLQKTPEVGRKWVRRTAAEKTEAAGSAAATQEEAESQKQLYIQRRGGEIALTLIVEEFGEALPEQLPTLWEMVMKPLEVDSKVTGRTFQIISPMYEVHMTPSVDLKSGQIIVENMSEALRELSEDASQEMVKSLQVLETIGTSLCKTLAQKSMPCFLCYLQSYYTAVRHMAARCFGMLSQINTPEVMSYAIEKILPLMRASDYEIKRLGASEAVANILERLGMDVIPYIVLLIVPVLGRMSDQNKDVRTMATHCFATLIRLLPLEAGVPDAPDMSQSLLDKKAQERKFLDQLIDSSKLENYKVDVPIKADLRKYQQDGLNWLGFLNKYSLHGILCDDMGLGKTLQSICIIAEDHHRRALKFKETQDPDCTALPSIVVCPPSLIGHWAYEVTKFIDKEYLDPLAYAGTPTDRIRLKKKVKNHNLIVASYDVVRNDLEFFSAINWNYCVLDEGHIIKNGKTKISKAVKRLKCNHRLILSGTPIQNNVLDLWSLFDFLVPGFLGTEKQFQARYGKPILASREAKSSSKEQEAGALAMETLHRQVLPFILRRLKEDVLQDLPPKIIQDYYCDLSPLQVRLYEDFAKSQAKKGVDDCMTASAAPEQKKKGSTHVFQALQYLRKVCNHPALVLNSNHPKYQEIMQQLKGQNSSLRDMQHAPKLTALKQLLTDCGIGVSESSDQLDTPVVNQHRVLLFCQLKGMLDIVEQDLLKGQMPSVTYMRLDGSVPAMQRHSIVNRFNDDPSIDLLLLTTHVGGLGLNLTGADTVIFVEHDWNPMKDLQAMDRAHRIGQKKVVNVYRLVTRGTLEEKIMGLQKFKITIANTVISQDNSSLQTMGTDQMLDLFSIDEGKKGQSAAPSGSQSDQSQGKRDTVKSVLEGLGDLWDENQYEAEYDMSSFMKSLAK